MAGNLQRPFLIGGGLLALGISLVEILHHVAGEWSVYALFALAGAAGVQWLHKQADRKSTSIAGAKPLQVDAIAVKRTLAEAEQVLTQLETEVDSPDEKVSCVTVKPQVSQLQSQAAQLATDLNRQTIRLAVMGSKGTGKTTVLQLLQSNLTVPDNSSLHFSEASSFTGTSAAGLVADVQALQQAMAADLVLFLVTADMTASELQTIQRVIASKRTLVVFNKLDHYLPADRQTILTQLQRRLQTVLPLTDIVSIAAAPNPIKVRRHQPDGTTKEWLEPQHPSITQLTQRLEQILAQESYQLVLASSLDNAVALRQQAKQVLNDVRRTRALPVVEQFQWIAAATAFASPLPTLDVLATAAINAQMIMDLSTLYRQKLTLQQAQKIAATLGSVMLKLGLVELSTQTIGMLLKTNALTYVAGGCIQGVSAAYLTRVAGLSLIEYFHGQEPNLTMAEATPLAIERFSQIVQTVFQRNQQVAFLQEFVGHAIARLGLTQATSTVTPPATPTASVLVPLDVPTGNVAVDGTAITAIEPLRLPLKPVSVVSERQEVSILDENGSSARLSVSSLDSTFSSH